MVHRDANGNLVRDLWFKKKHMERDLKRRRDAAKAAGEGDAEGSSSAPKKQRTSNAKEVDDESERVEIKKPAQNKQVEDRKANAEQDDAEKSEVTPRRLAPKSHGMRIEHIAKISGKDGGEEKEIKTYCVHDVSVPADYEGEYDMKALSGPALTSGRKMAKEYSFELDAFQRESVKCLERGESVLVSAHTSAGKTAIAEYAIAMSMRDKQRVIYTSPIKALSNQKYRELAAEFEDVGLMTGDTTINKGASCLVMTTEILRSMLYRGSEITREVAWVIFDEVHYMRDRERGVVWEETIILVPQKVRFVFLSATIPNAREFSEWISQLKSQPCHAVYTDARPVPLKHYLFPAGGAGLHLVVDEKGQFRADSFEKAMSEMASAQKSSTPGKGDRKRRFPKEVAGAKSDCFNVVKMIMERNFYPVIIFSFSRPKCESLAIQIKKLDFNTDEEKEVVERVFENAMDSLAEEDKKLPQIVKMLPMLKNGIGIHHSGLLPIVKEVVEILFQEGLIKALFATETFAMGLNMPAKTVFFTALQKFDGESFRTINGGEYIQMSGRAGRRGLDDQGIAILLCDEKLEPPAARSIMSGASEPLRSTFKLGYNMLLNLLRAEEADPEFLIARSFAQFQADRTLPQEEEKLSTLEGKLNSIEIADPSDPPDPLITEKTIQDYFKLRSVLEGIREKIRARIHVPKYISAFLQPGRLARVHDKDSKEDFGWGVVVKFGRNNLGGKRVNDPDKFIVDILLSCKVEENSAEKAEGRPKPSEPGMPSEWMVVPCSMSHLDGLSALRVYKPNDLRPVQHRASVGRSVCEAIRRFPDGLPLLDPLVDLKIKDEAFVVLLRQAEALEEAMDQSPVHKSSGLSEMMEAYNMRLELENEVKEVRKKVRLGRGLIFKDKLRRMKRVLRRLGFVSEDGVVEVKGRLACEVSTADELVLTEFIMGGALNDMKPEVVVSVMSCFIFDDKSKEEVVVADELGAALAALQAVAKRVGEVKKDCRLENIDVEQYVEGFAPDAMKVVYQWCSGESFQQVCSGTTLYEGSVVRSLRRLEELMRQLICAAKSIGNEELETKFEEGITKLRRGIPFQSSLYT